MRIIIQLYILVYKSIHKYIKVYNMIVHNVLDSVFSTWSNIAVLRTLRYTANGMTGRSVSKAAGMTPRAALASLTNLESLGLVRRIRGGRDHIFTLNRDHIIISNSILPLFAKEDEYIEEINKEIVCALKNRCLSIYQFGSVARHEDTDESDYDICIVSRTAAASDDLETLVLELSEKLHRRFGISLSPFYISETEFLHRLKHNKAPLTGIAKDGILLWGKNLIGGKHDKKDNKNIR